MNKLPPKLKTNVRDNGSDPKGFTVVDDDGDNNLFYNKKDTPKQQGWRDAPPPYIGDDAMEDAD